jgi:hypothetical protein
MVLLCLGKCVKFLVSLPVPVLLLLHTHTPPSPLSWSLDRLLSRSRLTSYITACVAWFKNAGVEERPSWSRVGSSDELRPGLEV